MRQKYPRSIVPTVCFCCKIEKLAINFVTASQNKNGLSSWCKQCTHNYYIENQKLLIKYGKNYRKEHIDYDWRERQLKNLYGIAIEEYNLLFQKQNGKCAICNNTQLDRRLAVDHDHKTGKIRGLLCQKCNTALGRFEDNSELLKRAIQYLEED
jgi:hypothetical protein